MKRVTLTVGGRDWSTDLTDPTRISIQLNFDGPQPKAFGLEAAVAEPIGFDGELADTETGGEFNCESLRLIPHGNGTHTESAGHLVGDALPIGDLVAEALIPTTLATVSPMPFDRTEDTYGGPSEPGDPVITRDLLARAVRTLELPDGFRRALVLRTEPNPDAKRSRNYSGTNPPYLTDQAVAWIRKSEVNHLLVDLPSLDREHDEGKLVNHRAFWSLGPGAETVPDGADRRTITEMVYVPNTVEDGVYFLDIEVPDFDLDAAPSRPLLYEAIPVE